MAGPRRDYEDVRGPAELPHGPEGYDPDEVDRHLELVSRWFTETDAAKALREERMRIEERERAAAEREASAERSLEGVRMEAEATIEGAQRRAAAEERAAQEDRAAAAAELEAAREEGRACGRAAESRRGGEPETRPPPNAPRSSTPRGSKRRPPS